MKLTKQKESEALKLYHLYWDSYIKGDLETFASTLHEAYDMIGTADSEVAHNKAEGIDYFKAQMQEVGGKSEWRNRQITAKPLKDMVLINEDCDIYVLGGPEWTFYSKIRISTLLHETDSGWKIIQQHGSFPDMRVQEGETLAIDKISRENVELRDAVKRRTTELENKNRELEIEAALERVRARTIAMRSSDELAEASSLLFQQMEALGVSTYSSGFTIWDEKQGNHISWMCNADGSMNPPFRMPLEEDEWHKEQYESWKKGEDFIVKDLTGEEMKSYFRYLRSFPLLDEAFKTSIAAGHPMPDRQIHHAANFSHGNLLFITLEPVPEAHDIFKRFANVFEQTYTRFLDLQKAEAQAREAQIEAALERVRARTMAMQKSEELADAAFVLFEQLRELGGNLWGTGFGLCEKDSDKDSFWFANENGVFPPVSIPNTTDPAHQKMYEEWKAGRDFLAIEASGKNLKSHYDYMLSLPEVKPFFQKILDEGLSLPESQQWNAAYFSHGYLLIITLEPYPDPDILKRFARVFDQTYTRFLDLKKAEAQARESEIQLALERVRARSMAMHKSEELADLSMELVQQVQALGIDTWFCAFNIYDDHPDGSLEWGSNGQGTFPKYRTPREGVFRDYYEAGQRGETLLVNEIGEEDCPAHYDYLCSLPGVGDQLLKMKNEGISFPEYQIDHVAFFKYGYIIFITFEPVPESHDIFKRFAKVFQQTYTRFLDLQKSEEQAKDAQIEAALERVRSRSLAMHKPDELQDVVRVVAEELKNTGVILDTGGAVICTYFQDSKDVIHWTATEDPAHPSVPYLLPYFEDELFDEAWESKSRGDDYFAKEFSYDVKNAFFNHAFEHSDYRQLPDEYKKVILESKSHGIAWAWSENSAIMIPSIQGDLPSEEEKRILIRFAKVFEQSFIRFLDLEKAEAQAREAKIEAALEKVRSRTMGMQSSDELPEVANLLFLEVQGLGIPAWSCGYNIMEEDKKSAIGWMSSEGVLQEPFKLRLYGEASFDEMREFLRSYETMLVQELGGEALEGHYEHMKSFPDLHPTFENIEAQGLSLPTFQINHLCKFSRGFLLFITYEPVPDAHDIFKRFTNVFDQTYTRFLDLKKAEAQARESQIEAALERVRSRSMGMQKSSDLQSVVDTMYGELKRLGLVFHAVVIQLLLDDTKDMYMWINVGDGSPYDDIIHWPYVDIPMFNAFYEARIGNKTFDYRTGSEAETREFFEEYFKLDVVPKERKEVLKNVRLIDNIGTYQKHTGVFLMRHTEGEYSEKDKEIVRRFSKVFEQTYTRFLDLQKAEEQAREAQIGNALEKVRSRSLAMQSPDELIEVAQLLREEMGALGVEELETSSIYIHDKQSGLTQCWFTIKDADDSKRSVTDQMTINLKDTWVGRQMDEFYRSNQDKTSILMKGDQRIEWIRYCEEKSDLFGTSEFYGESIPERTYHLYKFSNGILGAASPGDISNESWDLMKRATGVFSFAYTRFLDLQKAEESARRARQQASLDRVRADISYMRSAEDLNRVTPLIWNELTTLGIPFIRCGVFIIHESEEQVEVYLSKPDGTSLAVMHLPFDSNELTLETVEAWRNKEVYTQHWSREEFLEWGRSMMEQDQVSDMKTYQGAEEAPESLHLHFIPFNQGMLYVGSTGPLDNEEISLSESLAKAFSIAYARYEDFVKLEKAKAGIEDALSELKATQSQLVQQEKLASLGQLTAGIAHEIKNPLNFVNNFSDVSLELVEEVRDEVRRMTADGGSEDSPLSRGDGIAEGGGRGVSGGAKSGDHDQESEVDSNSNTPLNPLSRGEAELSPQSDLILEILNDIEANLRKIYEHGTRADSIVKSMLQHSRGGDGVMEPTPLNPLIKEYVNLAFHGMRAGKEPINVDIDMQLDESIGKVPLIAEDFSRVILNLTNNAFDAMREKSEKAKSKNEKGNSPLEGSAEAERRRGVFSDEDYTPKLTVRTHKKDQSATIEIEDNGRGIPDDIKDKIMQPFFTTKKGTQGTGLGLSITNDIIKAHGGEIDIESVEGMNTRFIIKIPRG